MKRVLVPIVLAIAVTAFIFRGHWLPTGETGARYLGYVEGETALIAPPTAGRLVSRDVDRGATVKKGDRLFLVDPAVADAEIARSEAAILEAMAMYENLQTGKREQELEVIRAQRREAEAQLDFAEKDLSRMKPLVPVGAASKARYDQSASQVDQLKAKVQQLKAQEVANELGGRTQEIDAAKARITEAISNSLKAASQRRDIEPKAPSDAYVEDTFFEPGEWVAAGKAVVSLLSPDKIKLRFFVPEADVAKVVPGRGVAFTCDGCAAGQKAIVTYVSPRAEYTPPVIYSESAREKLVFLVEAKPVTVTPALRPGLPVDVTLAGEAPP